MDEWMEGWMDDASKVTPESRVVFESCFLDAFLNLALEELGS